MKPSLSFRRRLALLSGVVRLLAHVIRTAIKRTTPSPPRDSAPVKTGGRTIEGESLRIDSHYDAAH